MQLAALLDPRWSAARGAAHAAAEVAPDARRLGDRAALVEARDPRGLSQPGHLSRRAAGSAGRRRTCCSARRPHGIDRCRGAGAGGAAAGAQRGSGGGDAARVEAALGGCPGRSRAASSTMPQRALSARRAAPGRASRWRRTSPAACCAARTARRPVESTLDAPLQSYVAASLRRHLLAVRDRSVRDGAVLVARQRQRRRAGLRRRQRRSLQRTATSTACGARRQAGSALKPFLYGMALDRRLLTAASLLEDTPLELPVAGGLYRPRRTTTTSSADWSACARRWRRRSTFPPCALCSCSASTRSCASCAASASPVWSRTGGYYGPSLALGSARGQPVGAGRTPTALSPRAACGARCACEPARAARHGA